jgi:hypothetical protein
VPCLTIRSTIFVLLGLIVCSCAPRLKVTARTTGGKIVDGGMIDVDERNEELVEVTVEGVPGTQLTLTGLSATSGDNIQGKLDAESGKFAYAFQYSRIDRPVSVRGIASKKAAKDIVISDIPIERQPGLHYSDRGFAFLPGRCVGAFTRSAFRITDCAKGTTFEFDGQKFVADGKNVLTIDTHIDDRINDRIANLPANRGIWDNYDSVFNWAVTSPGGSHFGGHVFGEKLNWEKTIAARLLGVSRSPVEFGSTDRGQRMSAIYLVHPGEVRFIGEATSVRNVHLVALEEKLSRNQYCGLYTHGKSRVIHGSCNLVDSKVTIYDRHTGSRLGSRTIRAACPEVATEYDCRDSVDFEVVKNWLTTQLP